MPSPYAPDDADTVLDDFAKAVVCSAAPHVTRALFDDAVVEGDVGGRAITSKQEVLKVKRGAFAGVAWKGSTVAVPAESLTYRIERELERPSSLFDYYAIQPLR
ncbi:head-tail joining protein [Gemmatimonas aurantiaca]|uniref:head-tail joining protein n=1 Tax=Gemmatimonas aurantiaca TaxID=173480 RepID=UPI0012EA3B5D|nr:hypothetical protein [Gemmatimonas aurantiaca]